MLQSCLAQMLPSHAELAAPLGPAAAAETVHQLRVGLRRTRTALREFGRGIDGVDAAWGETLARAFRDLGAQRDRDVIAATLAAAREAARAAGLGTVPDPADAPAGEVDPTAMLRTAAFNTLLLDLIGFVVSAADADGSAPLRPRARERLKRLHRQVCVPADRFAVLPDDERHRLRKRAKRLRYTLEFCSPLFGRKAVARYLGLLRQLQQGLGDLNDLLVADAWLAGEAPADAGRAFLRGWVAARREAQLAQGAAALRALARADCPWA
jgi:triphosphatase